MKKGNKEVHDWVNKELEKLGKENFLHTLYDKHLKEEFGPQISPESVITEGGKVINKTRSYETNFHMNGFYSII